MISSGCSNSRWSESSNGAAIGSGLTLLERFPFTCRKASSDNAFLRELVIPFGHSGHVALFEITDASTVLVAAVRHQLEDDYH